MNKKSQSIALGLACIIAALVVYTQSGCGGNARHATIVSELAALKTARTTFHQWDVARQVEIGGTATSREEGEKKLAEHRRLRNFVTRVFAYAYDQLAEAAAKDDMPTLDKARDIAVAVIKGLKAFKPGADPPPLEDLGFPCNAQNLEVPWQLDGCP